MRAYCWASGRIGFGRHIPEGALPIAHSRRSKKLQELIGLHARHGYQPGMLLVPGIPEAPNQLEALEALKRFINRVEHDAPVGVLLNMRGHRWPIEGKPARHP
jgi:hypothetical protein